MIWHWKIAETLARKFKQLSVHFYFVAFFWKTGLLILAFKCDIYGYGRVFSRPCVHPYLPTLDWAGLIFFLRIHRPLSSLWIKESFDLLKQNIVPLQLKSRLMPWWKETSCPNFQSWPLCPCLYESMELHSRRNIYQLFQKVRDFRKVKR